MWTKVKAAFVCLAVFLFAGLIFRDDPTQSPGQAVGMLAMAGIALLILMALVSCWRWLKRQLLKEDDKPFSTGADTARRSADASRKRGN